MSRGLDDVLLARDVYSAWKRRVKAADASVRVFTPYLDRLLESLLGNANVASDVISVVTDLSPASGALEYRRQLLGARAVLKRDIEVRSLPRLHAKVLICDESLVSIGSQNFTSYGRRSHETTAVLPDDVSGTEFIHVLNGWFYAATPVTLDFVEQALEALDDEMKALADAQRQLLGAFEAQWMGYLAEIEAEQRRQEAERRRQERVVRGGRLSVQLARAVRASSERLARDSVWAHLTFTDPWSGIWTLRADKDSTFTKWTTRGEAGQRSTLTLDRLKFHPVILHPTGRMGFARLGRQQISYVRDSVKWDRPREILGRSFDLIVRFPNENLDAANIELGLTVNGSTALAALQLRVRFDGIAATLTSSNVDARQTSRAFPSLVTRQQRLLESVAEELDDPANLARLVARTFEPFKYSELGVEDHNAEDFFPTGWVRVTPIDFRGRTVLVAMPE